MLNELEIQAIPLVRADLRPYVEGRNSPLISEMDQAKAILQMAKKLEMTQKALSKRDELHSEELAKSALNMFKVRYPSLTIFEFGLMCDNATLGDYGIIYIINLPTIGSWAKAFHSEPKRHEAFGELNKAVDSLVLKRADKPLKGISVDIPACQKIFNEYKEHKVLPEPMFCFLYYEALVKNFGVKYQTKTKGEVLVLVTDSAVRKRISTEAEEDYTAYVNRHKGKVQNPDSLNVCFETLLTGDNRSFDNRVKRLMVKHFFDELIKSNTELSTLIGKEKI